MNVMCLQGGRVRCIQGREDALCIFYVYRRCIQGGGEVYTGKAYEILFTHKLYGR